MKYTETKEDRLKIEEFIRLSAKNHRPNGRSIDQIKDDIRIGKLGEIAYKSWMGDLINDVDWSSVNQGTGEDFVNSKGKKIQVKTIRHDTKWCSFYNWNFDYLVCLRQIGSEIHFVSSLSKPQLKSKAIKSNWEGWYFYP